MVAAIIFWVSVVLIVYAYAGYPALLAALARLKPAKVKQPDYEPEVTLLIAAYNEASVIASKIENSLALDYPREKLQILIAADGSDDATPEVVRSFAEQGIELSYSPERRGKMAAINRAVPQARGAVIVFSDANNMYEADVIRRLAAPFIDEKVGMVTGAKHIVKDERGLSESEGLYWRYESFIKKQESRLGSAIGAPGEISAIRRELFRPPPEAIINDDFYMAADVLRRGYRVLYDSQARSFEPVSASAEAEMKRRARIVAGRYQVMLLAGRMLPWRRPLVVWQMVSHKFLRPLVPFFMIGALLANIAAVLWPTGLKPAILTLAPPVGWIMLALQALFYLTAWVGRFVPSKGIAGKLFYLPVFLVNSNLAALVGLVKFFSGKQTVLWERVERSETPPTA